MHMAAALGAKLARAGERKSTRGKSPARDAFPALLPAARGRNRKGETRKGGKGEINLSTLPPLLRSCSSSLRLPADQVLRARAAPSRRGPDPELTRPRPRARAAPSQARRSAGPSRVCLPRSSSSSSPPLPLFLKA
ncbi:hypothetical protein PVAP13_7NG110757 [Panicum virgatum]|uniref:Uncharacterized protein n=1 Tax=Panicum virgatum TaxID=38727 RepID=A0A8T0PZX1_PANVG|nr:hypothetical protein PVAP13_7NG110757 [Panicum virgatum]